MLTYNYLKRPSFAEMNKRFLAKEAKMKTEIQEKYNDGGADDFDDGLQLTKSISPYVSRPTKAKNIMDKFK